MTEQDQLKQMQHMQQQLKALLIAPAEMSVAFIP